MFEIHISLDQQWFSCNVYIGTTSAQIIDLLRTNNLVPKFVHGYCLKFNGHVLSPDLPISYYGIGPQAILEVVSVTQPGFGGGGRETLLQNLLQAFAKLKKL